MRAATAALVLALAACPGCGSGTGGHGCPRDGIVWLSWTIKGAGPSMTSCAAVDHLALELHTNCGGVLIDPIPCIVGLSWEYRDLPDGPATAVLNGIDTRGAIKLQGIASVTLDTTKPAMPTAIDLQ